MTSRLLVGSDDKQKHQLARLNLHQALDAMPESYKTEYLEATKLAPRLVATESDPVCFLRYADFNCWDAAERLVSHWKERKYVFGEKRAFLPLSLTGETALSRETISLINQGCVLFLPNDSRGRSLLYIYQSKLKHLPVKIRLELVFYCNMVQMKNPQSQKDGVVMLSWMDTVSFNRGAKTILQVYKNSIPNRMHSLHVLCGSNPILEGIVNSVLERYNKATNQNTYIHLCKTSQAAADMLLPYDIKKECLPRFLGGSWNSTLLQCLSIPQQIPRFADDSKPPARNLPGEDSIPPPHQSGLLLPTQYDVLLGQGKSHVNHEGNRYLHYLINLHIDRYKSCSSRVEIKRIKREVFNAIKKSGRFLSLDATSQKWNEVSDSHALEKIGQTFRNCCKKSSKTKGRASTVAASR